MRLWTLADRLERCVKRSCLSYNDSDILAEEEAECVAQNSSCCYPKF
jgi:hypothetical protein